ncbi:MAG TPA: hypothetical protein VGI03_11825 [Verrucomicrobiae bacterium]|jgi:hypothetical protein
MNKLTDRCCGVIKVITLLILYLARGLASGQDQVAASEPFDYAKIPLFTGTVYAIGSDRTNILFTFRRTATRSGSTVHVDRLFNTPDGRVAAQEHVLYESGNMVSFEMNNPQAGLWGTMKIVADPDHAGQQKLIINHGSGTGDRGKGVTRDLPKDLLTDDSIYPFILIHWDELMQGATLKFSMVAFERDRAFNFTLRKTTGLKPVAGQPTVWLKMTAANVIVARFVNPIYFGIEQAAPHRVLEYIGRTAPMTKKGNSWKYLDAETVFDWK